MRERSWSRFLVVTIPGSTLGSIVLKVPTLPHLDGSSLARGPQDAFVDQILSTSVWTVLSRGFSQKSKSLYNSICNISAIVVYCLFLFLVLLFRKVFILIAYYVEDYHQCVYLGMSLGWQEKTLVTILVMIQRLLQWLLLLLQVLKSFLSTKPTMIER